MTTPKNVMKMIKDNDVKYVDFRFTDPRGKWQHVTFDITHDRGRHLRRRQMFDGSSIAGWKAINESDMCLMPDPVTAMHRSVLRRDHDGRWSATCSSRPPASPTTAIRAASPRRPKAWSSRWASATPSISAPKPNSSCSTTCATRPSPTTPASSSTPSNSRPIPTPNMRAAISATASAPRRATSRCRRRIRCRTCARKCSRAMAQAWASRSRSTTTRSPPPSTNSA